MDRGARHGLIAVFVLLAACSPPSAPAGFVSIAAAPAYQNAALLRKAWALPVAYADDGFEYQANPSICGPTSVANVVQSFGHRETQSSVLRDAHLFNIFGVLPGGVTLDQARIILARESGREVTLLRDVDLPAFRAQLALANDPRFRFVINFDRRSLFGRGHGHFSPILAYLPDEDLVFVGDVNAHFKPWLASPERLYAAINTVDSTTGKTRGLLRIALTGDVE